MRSDAEVGKLTFCPPARACYNDVPMHLSADQRAVVLDAARDTIRATLGGTDASAPAAAGPSVLDDPVLRQPAGCFVSLHHIGTHRLRGCVGRLDAKDELLAAIRE